MGDFVGGLFGSKPKTGMMRGAMFQPYTYKSLTGETSLEKDGDQYTFSQTLDPRLQGLFGSGLDKAQPFLERYLEQTQREVPQFAFESPDVGAREQQIMREQAALLQPSFAQQRQQLRGDLFGSGRLGLKIAGEGVGAGAGGMVNPDAFGLGRAQSMTLAELAPQARQMARDEQAADFARAAQTFGIQEGVRQQQLQNLLAGYSGAMTPVQDIINIESGLVGGAAGREQAIRNAASGAMYQTGGSGGLLGTALQSAAMYYGAGGGASDVALKENVVKIGEYPSGLNMYSWDWNEEGKKVADPNQPTVGVIAQEAILMFPDAVLKGNDGYLRVDYKRIM